MQSIFNKLPTAVFWIFWIIVGVHVFRSISSDFIAPYMTLKMMFVPIRYFNMDTFSYDIVSSVISPLTYSFLHADFRHIFMNLALFLPFGMVVAQTVGNKGFVVVYVLGALVGAFLIVLLNPTSNIPVVGASASVSALVGFVASASVLGKRFNAPFESANSTVIFTVVWFLMNVVYPFMFAPNISWEGHLGGFAIGFVASPLLIKVFMTRRYFY